MAAQVQITARSVEERDRKQLANLIHFEPNVHRHLDWRPPLDWLGRSPYLVAEGQNGLLAALVCPPDPPEVAWIRLFAVSSDWNEEDAWQLLWSQAKEFYLKRGDIQVAAIPLQSWFRSLLTRSGFLHDHNIVILAWERAERQSLFGFGQDMFPRRHPKPSANPLIHIRPMNSDDLPAVFELDMAAFGPLWRNSLESIQLAFKQSAVAAVALDGNRVIGYQISTAGPIGGHLARLAVNPEVQGQGIGYALVSDLLNQFERRGATRVTVNTQEDNLTSLSLYRKAGFQETGEVYPVFQFPIKNGN